jgi:L-lactate dehydrogenase complex protein LldF
VTAPHPQMPTYLGMPSFPVAAATAVADSQLRRNLTHATHTIRAKRAAAVAELADWEALRAAAKAIKDHTLANLDTYLLRLEANVTAAGGHVHWAQDAAEANAIVAGLVRAAGADRVVKVKSMTTQETGLNEALAADGIDALETDLAELIVQLGHDRPSHILVPAIHRNRSEIREIFRREMPDAPAGLTDDPAMLAAAAPAAPAPGVPVGAGRYLRRELRDRRDRLAGRGGVRGQRPDVPDAAADAHLGGGDREDPAVLA